MAGQSNSSSTSSAHEPRDDLPPQYSLQAMFLATTLFALVCGLCFAVPNDIAGIAIIALRLLVPICLLAWAVYGTGPKRVFCIGALLVTGPRALDWSSQLTDALQYISLSRLANQSTPSSVDSEHLFEGIVAVGVSWRPGVVASWLGGVAAGLIFVIAGRIARQNKARHAAVVAASVSNRSAVENET